MAKTPRARSSVMLPRPSRPDNLDPMLATAVAEPFDGDDWLFEVKWDGYRILAHCQKGLVRLQTRNHEDYTQRYRLVADQLNNLQLNCILDGEMVVVDEHGRSDFGALQNYMKTGEGMLMYYVFDLPYAHGRDLRKFPLTRRKLLLSEIIAPLSHVRLSDDLVGEGKRFFELARTQQLEGIMAKRADSTYQAGKRSRDWLKVKVHQRQEAVVAGFTEPQGSRKHLGALVLGLYDDRANSSTSATSAPASPTGLSKTYTPTWTARAQNLPVPRQNPFYRTHPLGGAQAHGRGVI